MSFAVQCARDGVLDESVVGKPLPVNDPAAQTRLVVPLKIASGVVPLKIQVVFYYCREGAEGLCRIGNVAWAGGVHLDPQGEDDTLRLEYTVDAR